MAQYKQVRPIRNIAHIAPKILRKVDQGYKHARRAAIKKLNQNPNAPLAAKVAVIEHEAKKRDLDPRALMATFPNLDRKSNRGNRKTASKNNHE